jgi:hypothetical protein
MNRFIGSSLVVTTNKCNTFKITAIVTHNVLNSHVKCSQVFYELPVTVSYREHNWTKSQSQSHIATDDQSISKSSFRAPSGAHDRIFITLWQLLSFFWDALSDKRTNLSFVYAAGPRQRSLSRVRVPWVSWPYFTVLDLILPFSSPPTARRVTLEVFDLASTRVTLSLNLESYVTTDGQSASLFWNKAPIWDLRSNFYYCHTVAVSLIWSALSDERTGLSHLLLALTSSVVFGFESRGTRDHIILPQIRDFLFRHLLRF